MNIAPEVGAAVVTGAFTVAGLTIKFVLSYMRNNTEMHVKLSNNLVTIDKFVKKLTANTKYLEAHIQNIDKKLNFILDNQYEVNKFKDDIDTLIANLLTIFANVPEKYKYFAQVKAESIASVETWMHDKGFYLHNGDRNDSLTYELFMEKVSAEILKINAEGIAVFGEDTYTEFMKEHAGRVERFLADILAVFNDEFNGKHHRVHKIFKSFINDSIIAVKLFVETL